MPYIERELLPLIQNQTLPKVVIIFGTRRTGKTTMLRALMRPTDNAVWFSGDDPRDIDRLKLLSSADVRTVLASANTIVIHEAQRIPDIGLLLKRLVDVNETLEKPVRLFATGSSSLELAKGVKESAVGRLIERQMWPLSVSELAASRSWAGLLQNLDWHLVYGCYPEVCTNPENASITLRNYCNGILFQDAFNLGNIRLNEKFEHLLRALAESVGFEVNYDNLSRETGLNRTTVGNYVSLLEKCFIVKVCHSFSRNLTNELKKGKKIYFCDNGIRNAILGKFDAISTRDDAGALWESFFFMERIKLHSLRQDFGKVYFWRTSGHVSHEIDFIEVVDGKMKAFECKLSAKAKAKPGDLFRKTYPDCSIDVVTPDNFFSLWLPKG